MTKQEVLEPEKVTPSMEERLEMVRMVDFLIHTEMCGYFGNGQADEQDKEIIRTVKLWQKIRALVLAPPESTKVSREFVFNLLLELYGQVDGYKLNKAIEMFREKGIVAKEEK